MPAFLRPVAGIKYEMSSFSGKKCKNYLFKHLLCSLCSIVNKILAHVILFKFKFYSNLKKASQHFRVAEFGLYNKVRKETEMYKKVCKSDVLRSL